MEKNSLSKIKKNVKDCVGKKVIVKANKGRRRIITREGTLESAYPNVFVVKISNDYNSIRRVSYTYSDILTKTVEVTVCEGENKTIKAS